METVIQQSTLPRSLAEFELWEPVDGFKYEWNDGEIIKFEGMKKKHMKLIDSTENNKRIQVILKIN